MRPPADAVERAAAGSPLVLGPAFSDLADPDELRYREQIEPARDDPEDVAAWIERKEPRRKLGHALKQAAFEHEYHSREYLDHFRSAGFEARHAPAAGGFRTPLQRALLRPPLAWMNGILFSEFTYVGRRPA